MFDGTTWTQVSGPGPGARAASILVYDSVAKQLILFGGFNGRYLNDTWTWNGATSAWTHVFPAHKLSPVTAPMGFTDPINGHADVIGGYSGLFYYDETYQWTGSTWIELQTPKLAERGGRNAKKRAIVATAKSWQCCCITCG